MKNLAIIPARGGSKGIPNKNLVDFLGEPLIGRTIRIALETKRLDKVIVSTDNEKIADISKAYGAEVPFLRPEYLAGDTTCAIDVDIHAINWLENNQGYKSDFVIHLQPTSPLRSSNDINMAIQLFLHKEADSIVSLCESSEHPNWMKTVDNDGKLIPYLTEDQISLRQDLPKLYSLNGAIYIAKTNLIKEYKSWYFPNTFAYIMERESSIDIDNLFDLEIARMIAERNKVP